MRSLLRRRSRSRQRERDMYRMLCRVGDEHNVRRERSAGGAVQRCSSLVCGVLAFAYHCAGLPIEGRCCLLRYNSIPCIILLVRAIDSSTVCCYRPLRLSMSLLLPAPLNALCEPFIVLRSEGSDRSCQLGSADATDPTPSNSSTNKTHTTSSTQSQCRSASKQV